MNNIAIINNLLKIKLNNNILKKRICVSFLVFISISLIFINKLSQASVIYEYKVNIWDGVFTVLSNPFFILYLYIPLIIISTIETIQSNKFYKYILVRTSFKRQNIITNIIYDLIISIFINTVFFIIIFILCFIYFPMSLSWSNTILNLNMNMPIKNYLFPNNFVFELIPLKAFFILYLKFILTTYLVLMFRDFILNFVKNIKLAYIIIILYLLFNLWLFFFPPLGFIGKAMQFFSYNGLILIWYNKFNNITQLTTINMYPVTVSQSLIIGFIFLLFIALFRILLAKKAVIRNV